MPLEDYLDAYPRLPQGRLGTLPVGGLLARSAPSSSPALAHFVAVSTGATAPAGSLARAIADSAMWTLDADWTSRAAWFDARVCATMRLVGDSEPTVTPWAELPTLRGRPVCRNALGADVPPTCRWGFWKLPDCSLTVATKYQFQFQRYLWAQQRMRELLAAVPVQGTTDSTVAAAWCWEASSLISVLLWATNCRFSNPNPAGSEDYGQRLVEAGALMRAAEVPSGAIPILLATHVWNAPPSDLPFTPPQSKDDFAPSFSMSPPATQYGPRFYVPSSYAEVATLGGNPYGDPNVNPTLANAADANALRARGDKALLGYWFALTWGARGATVTDARHQVRPLAYRVTSGPSGGVTSGPAAPINPTYTSAKFIVDDLRAQLEHYVGVGFFDWIKAQNASYVAEVGSLPNSSFKETTLIDLVATGQQIATAQALAGSPGAEYGSLALSLVSSLFTLIGGIGTTFAAVLSAYSQALDWFLSHGGGAVGNSVCPAYPFLRAMSACDISTDSIAASALGVDSRATWPVNVSGQGTVFVIDGKRVTATYDADTDAVSIARRINAAAALAGLGPVATVLDGQVHVEGALPQPVTVTSSTAVALGFPNSAPAGRLSPSAWGLVRPSSGVTLPACPAGQTRGADGVCRAPSGGGGVVLPLAAGALILKFLLG